ncbi:ATP-dependent metalloprotease FtsH [Melghirimyces profundicolus]|uniref:ATP-dependent metalloprotease FtsH n=1 Tax=Melghirimyces profundicolus TaxID=1242148 RepID=A0A2T6BV48_9BACL|nr:AAA family ATPase [Melghirimyces profundicolus]PTX59950.1 ATP-dependent metalloprotease FtsH [Melghirimyces profundicolus]
MGKGIAIGVAPALLLFLVHLGYSPLPLIVLGGLLGLIYYFVLRPGGQMSIGRSKRLQRKDSVPHISFRDIGGQNRSKKELEEALDFLIHRDKTHHYGIRPIKGILLSGPPGTGKTLMAKAAAHYTDSVFVATSGSEFVEMYVGVGAQRIRELFQEARNQAKKNRKNSAIVFIDEIDVIGGQREGAQHREYDQTLNQLLTEMDGISTNQDVQILVIAATNRKDMLDSALLRPGRFDRHITVDLPDKQARISILKLHTQNKPLAEDADIVQIADETFGFSGAQLESLTNEAAIYALRDNSDVIRQEHLSQAIDKVMMGEKTDREATQEERERVAIHELGHAIVSEWVRPGSVSQVSLSPRGQALGYVRHHPGQDRYLYTRKQIEDQIMVCLAGAAAEEKVFQNRSTGAQNDYEQANRYIRTMIDAGLSDLGIINKELVSNETLHNESAKILKELHEKTVQLLNQYTRVFEEALSVLLKEEVLSGEQFRRLLNEYTTQPSATTGSG